MWAEIATSASTVLAPLLPALLKFGEKLGHNAIDKIGESMGEDTWGRVKKLWQVVSPELMRSPENKEAVTTLVADLNSGSQKLETITYALKSQLEGLLKSNAELADKVAALVKEIEVKDNQGMGITIGSQVAKNIVNATKIDNLTVQ